MEKAGKKILVTGATGLQGGAAAKCLIKNGWDTSALVRDPEKETARKLAESGVTLIKGDMNDKESLKKAMTGIYGVFSVQNFWEHGYDGELTQGKNLIDAAKDAGVKHFVYSSVDGAERNSGLPHFDVKDLLEKYLKESGLTYTILRPVFFMDNFNSWFVPAEQDGKFVISMAMKKDIKLQMIATDDIGRITEIVFSNPDEYSGKSIALAGDELTIPDAAKIYSEVKGGVYIFNELDVETVKSHSKEVGDMFQWFMDHGYTADISDLKKKFNGVTDFKTWLKG